VPKWLSEQLAYRVGRWIPPLNVAGVCLALVVFSDLQPVTRFDLDRTQVDSLPPRRLTFASTACDGFDQTVRIEQEHPRLLDGGRQISRHPNTVSPWNTHISAVPVFACHASLLAP
jgi:hypothetical protein